MNPQTPSNPPARRRAAIGPLQITAGVLALIILIVVVQNLRLGTTILWFFGVVTFRSPGVAYNGIAIATGWVVLISVLVGVALGYLIARGVKSRR